MWTGRPALAALGVIAVTLVWRGVLLRDSFFNQDDFYLSARAYDADLSWSFLFSDTAGHVNPMQQLAYWLVANHAPYEWGAVATFVLAMQLLAVVVLWHVLSRLLPGQWVRVPLLAVFAWSPLSAGDHAVVERRDGPVAPPDLLAARRAVPRASSTRAPDAAWLNYGVVLVATVMGLLVARACGAHRAGAAGDRRDDRDGSELASSPGRAAAPLAAVGLAGAATVGYLVGHAALTSVEGGGSDLGESASISWAFVGQNVLPGLASGPWAADLRGGAVAPAPVGHDRCPASSSWPSSARCCGGVAPPAAGRWRSSSPTSPATSRSCSPAAAVSVA